MRRATWWRGSPTTLGPAALNRAWTLVNDARDGNRPGHLAAVAAAAGATPASASAAIASAHSAATCAASAAAHAIPVVAVTAPRGHLADDGAQADRPVPRGGDDEQPVDAGPQHAALGARQDLGGGQAAPGRADDARQVDQHERRQHRGARPLGDEQPKLDPPAHSSPLSAAAAVARFSPAIDAVGVSSMGQNVVHD